MGRDQKFGLRSNYYVSSVGRNLDRDHLRTASIEFEIFRNCCVLNIFMERTNRNAIDGFDAGKDFGRDDDTVTIVHVLEEENAEVEIVEQRRTGVPLRMLRRYGLYKFQNDLVQSSFIQIC